MIRKFDKEEVLETFIETVREKSPISLVEQSMRVELSTIHHIIIEKTIEKLIRKASPNLKFTVEINPIHTNSYPYQGAKSFEPYFNPDPADVQFYVSRQAVPEFFSVNGGQTLTTTHINIDYYYPSTWTITPPRNKEMAFRRTMDEILFAWTIVLKTLTSAPIIRFDDEDEAAEAVFAFANAYLFDEVVASRYYHRSDFIRRLMYIQKAIRGSQPIHDRELATILYPPNKKVGQLEVPVVHISHNRLTQYVEGYLSCHGQTRYDEYLKVLESFDFNELKKEVDFDEGDFVYYLSEYVGRAPSDYRTYNMSQIQKLITSDNYRGSRPPMISASFKGISFNDICPFTYGSRSLTYIYFEKDFVSHLEKTFRHLDVESAVELTRRMALPKDDEINDGYEFDPDLINLDGLFYFWAVEGTPDTIERKDAETYKNKGLFVAENPPQERFEYPIWS